MKMSNIVLLLINMILVYINGSEIRLDSNLNSLVFKNNVTKGSFYFNDYASIHNCTCNNQIYLEDLDSNITKFFVFKNETEIFQPITLYVNNNLTKVTYNYTEINTTYSELSIFHTCYEEVNIENQSIINTIRKSNEWTLLKFKFLTGNNTVNSTNYLEFVKVCKEEQYVSRIIPNINILLTILLTTYLLIKYEFNCDESIRKFRSIRFSILYLISLLLFLILSPQLSVTDKILIGIYYIYIVTLTYCCYRKFKYMLNVHCRNILRRQYLNLKLSRYMVILFSFIFYYIWYLTSYHWFMNNIFVFAIICYMCFLFNFQNLYILVVGIASGVSTILIINYFENASENTSVTAFEFTMNYPIYYQYPKIGSTDPNCGCIISDYLSIVINIQLIKYCQKLDRILYVNKYFHYAVSQYIFYLILAALLNNFIKTEPLFQFGIWFFVYSLCFVIIYSLKKRNAKITFRGKVLPGENLVIQRIVDIEIEQENYYEINTLDLE